MQTIVYQCDTAMPAQKLPNCCIYGFNTIKPVKTVRLIHPATKIHSYSYDTYRLEDLRKS